MSGWDLVGALPLTPDEVAELVADGDTRWIGRGAYDLIDAAPNATRSGAGLPRAPMLYGSLSAQLDDPNSFASRLRRLLSVRDAYVIAASQQIEIPDTAAPGLLVMVHELPNQAGTQVTALNFSLEPIDEVVTLAISHSGSVLDMIAETVRGNMDGNELHLSLDPLEGQSLRINRLGPLTGRGGI